MTVESRHQIAQRTSNALDQYRKNDKWFNGLVLLCMAGLTAYCAHLYQTLEASLAESKRVYGYYQVNDISAHELEETLQSNTQIISHQLMGGDYAKTLMRDKERVSQLLDGFQPIIEIEMLKEDESSIAQELERVLNAKTLTNIENPIQKDESSTLDRLLALGMGCVVLVLLCIMIERRSRVAELNFKGYALFLGMSAHDLKRLYMKRLWRRLVRGVLCITLSIALFSIFSEKGLSMTALVSLIIVVNVFVILATIYAAKEAEL